jgi:hypothetical protein
MHDYLLSLAHDIACERIREAAAWRLAAEGRRSGTRAGTERLRGWLAARGRQPALRPVFGQETCES